MNNTDSKIVIAFSTKVDGSMKLSDGTNDFANIERFLRSKKIPSHFVRMKQIHSGNVSLVTDTSIQFIENTDSLVTNKKGVSLTVVTADCLPILLFDPIKNAIAAVHAGSKGLHANIIHHTVEKFIKTFGTDPTDLQVIIGPSIEQRCYEVGQEVIEMFAKQFSWFDESFYNDSSHGRYLLDLRKIALQCLIKEGILKEHISVEEACTKCSSDTYYSYRRGDATERFLSVISLL